MIEYLRVTKRNFCIVVNPTAGDGRALAVLKKMEEILATLPIHFHTVITTDANHAKQVAATAIKKGEYVAAVGGDGTMRAIAGILNKLQGVLALIPAGRGNDLVRMLNLPLDPISACKVLAHGIEASIDMAEVNEQPFLGICSLGFDSVAIELANRVRIIKGRAVYLYGGLRALFGWKPICFKVTVDGNEFEHIGYTVAVANTKNYGGGMYLAPEASIQDGLLDIILIGDIPKIRMVRNIPRLFKGTHINEPGFKMMRGRSVRIEADSRFITFADGDLISSPPANIRILPRALKVLVPA